MLNAAELCRDRVNFILFQRLKVDSTGSVYVQGILSRSRSDNGLEKYVGLLNVTSRKQQNHFRSHCEG